MQTNDIDAAVAVAEPPPGANDVLGGGKVSNPSAAHMIARAGTNITMACPGATPDTYIYLVEWKCQGCSCRSCPNPGGEGHRLMRYNQDRLTRWDEQEHGGDGTAARRQLDFDRYALRFEPVTSDDSGTYLCLMNNRQTPDSPVVLTVQGMYVETNQKI